MPRMINIFLILFTALSVLISCRKTPVQNTNNNFSTDMNIYPDSALTANFWYDTDSYWIYRDSISGRIDSFYVTIHGTTILQAFIHMGPTSQNPGYFENTYRYSTVIRQVNTDLTNPDTSLFSLSLDGSYARFSQVINDTSTNLLHFQYPWFNNISDAYRSVRSYPTYTLQGHTYDSVKLFTSAITDSICQYYVSSSPGVIIKMKFHQPTSGPLRVWELLRWHKTP